MDEKELEALFRAVPGDPPAPEFTLTDVTKASARATVRRRSALAATAVCVVALVAALGVTFLRAPGTQSAQPMLAPSGPSVMHGNGPRAESSAGCEKVDQALATALARELPADATGPSPGRLCAGGARSAAFHVTDGERHGVVSVTVSSSLVALTRPTDGTVVAEQQPASGGSLIVLSTPDAGSVPPLASQLARIAADLAARF
ncbi:MAG TPA: hypothetical protein VJ870_01245 [Amycolatopsis sp.]|nr:hypothetical protein [Amycolatopsis sp.]